MTDSDTLTDGNGSDINLTSGPFYSGANQGSAQGTLKANETSIYRAYYIISETVAANSGIGHMMLTAQSNFEVPLVFAGLVSLAIEGIGMYAIMAYIERKFTFWAHRSQFSA